MQVLTVIHPFGDYKRGDRIDQKDIKEVLAGENAHHVVKSEVADAPAEDHE